MTDIVDSERGIGPETRQTNRSSWATKVKEWIEDDESKAQRVAKDLTGKLKLAKELTDAAKSVFSGNARQLEWLEKASEALGEITKISETALEIKRDTRKVLRFIDAVNELSKIDVERNQMQAAKAFGKVFSTAGDLGDLLPKALRGPWSFWFDLLKKSGDFFSNVSRGTIPSEREIYRNLQSDPDVGHLLK